MRIGHAHLKVAHLERSIAFYRAVLGFKVKARYGRQAAFMAAGTYHHHLGLNTWHSAGGGRVLKDQPGLYHVAYLYPTLEDQRAVAANVVANDVEIYGHADHGVSIALYFDDPDGHGIEIYWDRPMEEWPRLEDGGLTFENVRFDVDDFIAGRVHKTDTGTG